MNFFPFKKNLVLVGMMGSGKTSLGLELSRHYAIDFFDSDHEIENKCNMDITDFFQQFGEEKFRDYEAKIIEKLLHHKGSIISAGGGAFVQKKACQHITQQAVSLWLDTPLDLIWQRIGNKKNRPLLLQQPDPFEKLSELYHLRRPFYQKADIQLPLDQPSIKKNIEKIINAIECYAEKKQHDF